jgi:hypothetical protein
MSLLSVTHPTLPDFKKTLDPNDRVAKVIEILEPTAEELQDMVWQEGNLLTGHRTTIRTGIPEPTFRKFYGGVQPARSTTAQVTDACAMMEAYPEVDKALADLGGNAKAYRAVQERGHLQGFAKKLSRYLWYGDASTEPEAFNGLAPRFSSTTAPNGENIINVASGGGGDAPASVWLVNWGVGQVSGIYPKGSKAGIQHEDKGVVTAENIDGAGGRAEMYRSHLRWDCGLCVEDWRYVARAQFDYGELLRTGATGAILYDLMVQLMEMLPDLNGRPAFYVSRQVRAWLRRQMIAATAASTLSWESIAGKPVLMFGEVPVRRSSGLLNGTETRIS